VKHGDELKIMNMHTGGASYLDVCGSTSCAPGTKYAVQTHPTGLRYAKTGFWKIIKTSGASGAIEHNDLVYLQNQHNPSYLDTCGSTSACGSKYKVVTNIDKDRGGHKTGTWKVIRAEGAGIVRYGDEVLLLNSYRPSYLTVCGAPNCPGSSHGVTTRDTLLTRKETSWSFQI